MGEVTAAIYARVSTEQQTRGNTVASQLALLRDKAQADDVRLEPDQTYIDEGYSGSTLVRPALERLRDAVAVGRIDRSIFRWVGVDRVSLREVCRRLQKIGCATRTGKGRWDATTICGMLHNPVYRGAAMFGRTRSMPAKPRLRPIGRRPQPPKRASWS